MKSKKQYLAARNFGTYQVLVLLRWTEELTVNQLSVSIQLKNGSAIFYGKQPTSFMPNRMSRRYIGYRDHDSVQQ